MGADVVVIDIAARFQDQTEPGISEAKRKTDRYEESVKKTQRELDRLSGKKWQATLEAKDKASAIIQKSLQQLKKFGGKTFTALLKVKDMATAPIRGVLKLLSSPIMMAGAVIGVTVGIKDTIDTYAQFEQSMANAASISGATGEEFKRMENLAKEMGRTTVFSASEAADAMYYMASAGYKAEQMERSLSAVMSLSSATQTELATTTDTVISTLNQFQMDSGQASRVADVFAAAIGNSQATMEKLAYSMRYAGPVANSLGYSLEETSAALSLLYDAGLQGEQAGTTLRGALSSLLNPTDKMIGTLGELGLSYQQINPATHSLADIIGVLEKTSISSAQSMALFGDAAGPGMIALIGKGKDKLDDLTHSLEQSGGAADKMAKRQLDTLQGAFKLMQSAAEGAKITIGERLKPHILRFTTWLTNQMPNVEKVANTVMDSVDRKIADLSETIEQFTSSNDWQNADFFGKVKIAWDKIIAEPFNEWWGSTGKAWMSQKAESIGQGLGSGLKFGTMGLLGIDVGGAVTDGASIGKSFAEGFVSGFDPPAVGKAILDGFKNMVKDAATVLPGGEETSSTGWLSAGLLGAGFAKMGGIKLLGGLAKGAGGLVGKVMPKQADPLKPFAGSLGTMSINAGIVYVNGGMGGLGGAQGGPPIKPSMLPGGKALTSGAGTAAKAGPVGLLAKFGTWLGSGATTTGSAAAVGGAAAAGGIVGGLGILSGIKDIYNSFRTQDKKEKSDLRWGGGTKLGMVGAGAGVGAAVGSVVPVVGTAAGALVGAGVGGLGALFAGNDLGEKIRDTLSSTVFDGGWWSEKWTFATQTAPQAVFSAIGTAVGFIEGTLFSGEWWAAKWNGAVDLGKQAGAKISAWWSENISGKFFNGEWWAAKWNGAIEWGKETGGKIADLWKTNISDKLFSKDWWSGKWNSVKEWGKGILSEISSWWGDMSNAYSEGKEKGTAAAQPHANGGIMTSRHYGMVAEEGPEAIIPLSPARRSRGLELWQQSGELLGVRPYAEGGIIPASGLQRPPLTAPRSVDSQAIPVSPMGRQAVSYRDLAQTSENPEAVTTRSGNVSVKASSLEEPIKIDLGGIHFEVKVQNAADPAEVIRIIKENLGNIADDLCQNLMRALKPIFGNMPINSEGL